MLATGVGADAARAIAAARLPLFLCFSPLLLLSARAALVLSSWEAAAAVSGLRFTLRSDAGAESVGMVSFYRCGSALVEAGHRAARRRQLPELLPMRRGSVRRR